MGAKHASRKAEGGKLTIVKNDSETCFVPGVCELRSSACEIVTVRDQTKDDASQKQKSQRTASDDRGDLD